MKTTPTIRFTRPDGEWFETDLDSLGIDDIVINHYGSLEQVLDDVVTEPQFVNNRYIFYEIIWPD